MTLKKQIHSLLNEDVSFRDFIFLPLFFALSLTWYFFHNSTFPLEQFQGRSISLATSEGIDIVKRVSTYYKGIGFFLLLALLFAWIVLRLKKFTSSSDLVVLNSLSVIGFCTIFFQLMGAAMEPTLHLIYALLFSAFTGIIGKRITGWKEQEEGEYTIVFSWLFLLSLILFFFQWHFLRLISDFYFQSIPDFCGIVTAALLFIYFFISGKYNFTAQSLSRSIRITQPLIFIPIVSVLAFEISMIFNQRGIQLGPKAIFFIGFLFILFRVFKLSRKEPIHIKDPKSQLNTRWIPWILAGVTALLLYKPIVTPDIDWFEDGNRILPLQQWFDFGKIPFLETFSSHALSDWGWGALYSLLNGTDPLGGFVYGFFIAVIITVLVYTLLLRMTGSSFLAVFVLLFYPYSDFLIPSYYQIVLLTLLLLFNLIQKQSTGNYFLFFSTLVFVMIWRIDLGISNFIAGIGGLALLWFLLPDFEIDRKSARKGFVYFVISTVLVFLVAMLLRGPSILFSSLGEMLGYLSSLQAYGLKDLTSAANAKYFSLYFVMPVAVLLIAGYAFLRMVRMKNPSSRESIVSIGILFLCIFYFSNLQRGLVRHTLAEQWDTALTSYGFLILICPLFYTKKKNTSSAVYVFAVFVLATIILANYKLINPELDRNNYYTEVAKFVQKPLLVTTSMSTDRTVEHPQYKTENYGDLDFWMKKNISDSSTFLDFSNTPMLYYFLNRKTPNYLCQIPHTAHNDAMQEKLLNGLSTVDIPVALFSNFPVNYWDQLDGIPNCMRHYKISEYIYKNYSPYALINHHTVWVKNGKSFPALTVQSKIVHTDFKNISVKGASLTDSISLRINGTEAALENILTFPLHLDSSKKYYVFLNAWYENQGTVSFIPEFNKVGYDAARKSEVRVFSGPSKAFYLIEPRQGETELSGLKIIFTNSGSLSLASLQVNSCDLIPDLVSEMPQEFALKNIPYIWGQFDEAWKKGKIGSPFSLLKEVKNLDNGQGVSIPVPSHHPDSVFAYLRLAARATTEKTVDLILRFGKDDETQGSFIFSIRPSDKMEDYLVRMSTLYNWIKKEHTWITLYAMNGNAAIETVELRRAEQ